MTSPGPSVPWVARYFRQQGELCGSEVFLGELTREEALQLVRPPVEGGQGSRVEGDDEGEYEGEYEALRNEALACRRCALAKTRRHVVFSDGSPRARVMVVGEAPGAQEDKTGRAFVGPAGKLLDLLLASVDLSRESSVYICNVLKCRPPGNRNPLPAEIQECTPFLRRQVELISPEVILALGAFAAQFLTENSSPLGRLRGEVYSYQGVPVVATYHPAALLRNPGWTRATWDDLQLLRQVMDGA